MSTEYTTDLTNANQKIGSGGNMSEYEVTCTPASPTLYTYTGSSYPVSVTGQQVAGPVVSYSFLMSSIK